MQPHRLIGAGTVFPDMQQMQQTPKNIPTRCQWEDGCNPNGQTSLVLLPKPLDVCINITPLTMVMNLEFKFFYPSDLYAASLYGLSF